MARKKKDVLMIGFKADLVDQMQVEAIKETLKKNMPIGMEISNSDVLRHVIKYYVQENNIDYHKQSKILKNPEPTAEKH